MPSDESRCNKCQKPKRQDGAGFSTRLIDICTCDSIAPGDAENELDVCRLCGKHISPGRSGSLTQWVFRADRCSCEAPQPVAAREKDFKQPAFTGYSAEEEESEIELSVDEFPVDRYRAIAILGRGAAGSVYLCRDRLLGKKVAVKTLHELTGEQLVSFQEEARATCKLSHAKIIDVLDFGATESGVPYMVMEYFSGVSLEAYLQDKGTLDVGLAQTVIAQLCEALSYAHSKRVFHRDLKPSNVLMLDSDEGIDVRLIDFGVAKVKQATGSVTEYQNKTLAGTPSYMAPDPVMGYEYDERSEVYSLGCVLFEALAGEPPFLGESAMQTISMHVNEPVPRLSDILVDVNPQLERLIERCLAKFPDDRFQTVDEVKTSLSDFYDGGTTGPETGERASRSNTSKILAVLGLTLLCGLVVVFNLTNFHNIPERSRPLSSIRSSTKVFEKSLIPIDEIRSTSNPKSFWFLSPADSDKLNECVKKEVKVNAVLVACQLADSDISNIVALDPSWVALNGADLTDGQLKILSKAKTLKQLRILESPGITANGFKHLRSLPELTYLSIRHCNLTNESLSHISHIKNLSYLDVEKNPGITVDGLYSLTRCKKLSILAINHTGADLSPTESEKLRKRLGLRVLWNSGRFMSEEGMNTGKFFRENKGLSRKVSGLSSVDLEQSEPTLSKSRISYIDQISRIDSLASKPEVSRINGYLRIKNGTPRELETLISKRVEKLWLVAGTYTGNDLTMLTQLPVKNMLLQLDGKDRDYKFLSKMRDLRHLTITVPRSATDGCLRYLKGSRIGNLTIGGNLSRMVWRNLPPLPSLALLAIGGNGFVESSGLSPDKYPGLKNLRLRDCNLSLEGFEKISALRSLETLYLVDSRVAAGAVEYPEGAFELLRSCSELSTLGVEPERLTDENVASISRLVGLRKLDFGFARRRCAIARISNFARLASLPDLESFHVAGDWISYKYLKELLKVKKLRSLSLVATRLSDEELSILPRMNLEELELESLLITEYGCKHIMRMKQLKKLNIAGERLSRSTVQILQKALPGCRVRSSPEIMSCRRFGVFLHR